MDFDRDTIVQKVHRLMALYQEGKLGGAVMPEDANPGLPEESALNYAYFTLPMALNCQRNSYTLWQSALQSYEDETTRDIFVPDQVAAMDVMRLRPMLTRYKVALQPNKQPIIWRTICTSFVQLFDGDVRNLFVHCQNSVRKTRQFLMDNKKRFPYLSGTKISNYWLYVMQRYTDVRFTDREALTIAPDTHVIQASVKLQLLTPEEAQRADVQLLVSTRWALLLSGTEYQPIDVHTPLWLWSRGKFSVSL